MSEKMLKFVTTKGQTPEKSSVDERVKNFSEIYKNYIAPKAEEQSSRCSQCGVPYCQIHCPLSNNIPDWLKLTAEGRLEEAYEVSSATNNMPEVCGRICPQDRLCEGNCVIERAGHGTVTIGSIEKFITDTAFENGWVKPIKVKKSLGYSIGIIGAGPAGLAAAEQLRKIGYEVTVYDKYDRPGGLLIYGIPNFKLEKNIVERRTKLLIEGGIKFHLNFVVGKNATLSDLKKKHDAILIATGVYKAREVEIPGSDLADNASYLKVFGQSHMIIVGSICAFLVSQLLDAFLFDKIKHKTGNRFIWLRSTGSTVVSQVIDSYIVLYIGFVLPGKMSFGTYMTVAPTNYILKLLIAVSLTPLIYLGHYLMRRYLNKAEGNPTVVSE